MQEKSQNICIYAKIVVSLHANLHVKEEKLSIDELEILFSQHPELKALDKRLSKGGDRHIL